MNLKSLYLFIFMLFIGTALMAQDKYEQGVVIQTGVGVVISLEGKETTLEKNTKKTPIGVDFSFLLGKVAELRNDGWEVWNSTTGNSVWAVTYFLRRKLK